MNQNEAHLRLLRPYDEPLPATLGGRLPDIPAIWGRAKVFFGRVVEHIGSAAAFSTRCVVRRAERRELMDRLKPVEKIVRAALVTRAVAFLLMTPEGRKLLRDTPKMALAEEPPPAPPPQAASTSRKFLIPGLYPLWRKPEPPKPPEPPPKDRRDPQTWSSGFRVMAVRLPAASDRTPPAPAKTKTCRPWIEVMAYTEEQPRGWVPPPKPEPKPKDPPALVLARRIDALGRVLENPARAIRRVARFIASLPAELVSADWADRLFPHPSWHHGHHELVFVRQHVRCALTALCRKLEPG